MAWCAGAVETVSSFVQSYKLWYSWFLATPTFWVLVIMANAPTILTLLTGGNIERWFPILDAHRIVFWAGWPGFFSPFMLLWLFDEHLLPSAVIRISERESFVQKYSAVLTFAVGAVAAIAAIIALFK